MGGRDAVLLAAMVMKGVNEIMTHDATFKKLRPKFDEIKDFKVIDPILENR